MTTILFKLSDIDPTQLVFGTPFKVGGGFEIPVKVMQNNVKYPLLIEGPHDWCFCYGLQESKFKDEKKQVRFTAGINVIPSNNPSEEQINWVNDFRTKIVQPCKQAVVDKKQDVKKPNITIASDLLNAPAFSRLTESKNGDLILNCKIRQYGDQIRTDFVDKKTKQSIPPRDMINKRCNVSIDLLIETIFIGTTITMQVKLDRAFVTEKKQPVIKRVMRALPPEPDDEIHSERAESVSSESVPIPVEDE